MLFFHSAPKNLPDERRIIISRTDKIGDLILSLPAFYMARKMYPTAKIAALVRSYNAGIVKNLPFIDETWVIDEPQEKLYKKISDFKADTFAALYSDNSVLKLALKSKAKLTLGPLSKPLSWFVYNKGIIQKRSKSIKNEAEYNLDIIRCLNTTLFDDNFEIGGKIICGVDNINNATKFITDNFINEPFILIHPFSGGSAKNFTDDQYVKLINKITETDNNVNIVLTSSTEDFLRLELMKNHIKSANVILYKNGTDILDLAALIDRCHVYVGASTGPSHIAGNLGKNAVLIYPAKPSQSPTRWGLYGNNNATYVIPDINSTTEDYSKKTFDNISDDLISSTAEKILNKLNNK